MFEKVYENIPNMIFGVSQQPYSMRLNAQCEEMENASPSVSEGLKKRQGFHYTGEIAGAMGSFDNAATYVYERPGSNDMFIFAATNNGLYCLQADDPNTLESFTPVPVVAHDGCTYLQSDNPQKDFRFIAVEDRLLLVNKTVATSHIPDPGVQPGATIWAPPSLVFVKQASYQTTYKMSIEIDGGYKCEVEYTTPASIVTDPDTGEDIPQTISTVEIASQLKTLMEDEMAAQSWGGFTISQTHSTLLIERTQHYKYTVEVSDTQGDTHIYAVQNKVQYFDNLPTVAPAGFVVEVSGDGNNNFDSYWVKFEVDDSIEDNDVYIGAARFGEGVWRESTSKFVNANGVFYAGNLIEGQYESETMPHTLEYVYDDTAGQYQWQLVHMPFDKASVGNGEDDTPSFVGHPIDDIFIFENRLGVVSNNSVVFSRSSEYLNFYRSTMTTLPDSDPVDIKIVGDNQYRINFAIPFNARLVLFCEDRQYVIDCEDTYLSPSNASTQLLTEYQSSKEVRPVNSGRNIFFVGRQGEFSSVHELYVTDTDAALTETTEISSHVPQYIPKNVSKIVASSNQSTVFLQNTDDPNVLYLYKYYWNGNEKIQSAWSKWVLPEHCPVCAALLKGTSLFVLTKDSADSLVILKTEIAPQYPQSGTNYEPHLDFLVEESEVTVETSATHTYFYTPYKLDGDSSEYMIVDKASGLALPLEHVTVGAGNTEGLTPGPALRIRGDHSDKQFYLGETYKLRFVYSPFIAKKQSKGGGYVAANKGRIQVKSVHLHYNDTGYFEIHLTPQDRRTITHTFGKHQLNSATSRIGSLGLHSGVYVFPVMCRNTEVQIAIENSSPYPSIFIATDWEGYHTTKR